MFKSKPVLLICAALALAAASAHAELRHSVVPADIKFMAPAVKPQPAPKPKVALPRIIQTELSHGMCFYCGRGMCKWSPCQGNQ